MNPLVSIVVPVYNVETYLDACVSSLVEQDLKDIEILLVDDGSTDASSRLCDAWAQRDDRIKVIHKENGGLSDARNVGVTAACAPYVGFVDSDDRVTPTMYQVLYENLKREQADISICGVFSCYADKIIEPESCDYFTVDNVEAMREILGGKRLRVWVPVKLYPTNVMRETPFPVGRTYEDAFRVVDIFSKVKNVVVDLRPQYYYWHHEGTISSAAFNEKTLDIIDAYEHCHEVVMRDYPELEIEARFRCFWSRFEVLDKILVSEQRGKTEAERHIVTYLRKHWYSILKNPYFGVARKLAFCALLINRRLYGVLARFQANRYASNA